MGRRATPLLLRRGHERLTGSRATRSCIVAWLGRPLTDFSSFDPTSPGRSICLQPRQEVAA